MIKENTLKYLGYGQQELSGNIEKLLHECIQEVEQISQPKVFCRKFTLEHKPLRIKESGSVIEGSHTAELLEQCQECLLIGCTLGMVLERKLKYYSKINMTKATVMDAAASAFLEDFCDRYEDTLGYKNRTYRLCPGYGDFPIKFNQIIAEILEIRKHLGVSITQNCLLIPQKSMLGLIGIGSDKRTKQCGQCVMLDDCRFRKRGKRCYQNESEKIY